MSKITQLEQKIASLQVQLSAEKKRQAERQKKARMDALLRAANASGLLQKTPEEIADAINKTHKQKEVDHAL